MGVLILLGALASIPTAPAIPQQSEDSLAVRARDHNHDGEYHITVDVCGGSLPFSQMVLEADLILHGTLAAERGRLSLDERLVYTEYDVIPYSVLKGPSTSRLPGRVVSDRLRVVLPGGSIEHEGLTITMTVNTLPHAERLRWGAEVVLFLTAHESEPGVYRVTGTEWGAFRVLDGKVVAMTREVARDRGDRPETLAAFLDRVQRFIASPVSVR
jgi:hypothetical protein